MSVISNITVRKISLVVGITERTIRKIITDLDEDGYISKWKAGRGTWYRINPELSMRTDAYDDIAIDDFLAALGWKRRRRRSRTDKNEGNAVSGVADYILQQLTFSSKPPSSIKYYFLT